MSYLVLVAALLLAAVGCSSSGKSSAPTSTTFVPALPAPEDTTWLNWNNQAAVRGYTAEANAVAKEIADKIRKAGLLCADYAESSFDVYATSYYKVGIPIPLGAGECDASEEKDGSENILIEVLNSSTPPTGEDFVAYRRTLLCQKAKDNLRQPDGTSGFPGIPIVMERDKVYDIVIQPDSFEYSERIAKALGLKSQDTCEGIK
jgi:hypothetical protein